MLLDRDLRDEAIAAAMGRLDVRRRPRIVGERPPNLADADLERAVAHVHVGPRQLEQIVLSDELTGMVHQVVQHREGLRRERHDDVAAAELSSGGIQPERSE